MSLSRAWGRWDTSPGPELSPRGGARFEHVCRQLRRQARGREAIILRSMPPGSARGSAANCDPELQGGGTEPDRSNAFRGPRSHNHARGASAAEPAQLQRSAKPSSRGAMTGRSIAWTLGAIFYQSCKVSVRVIAEAMGCSGSHGSKVRSGLVVPHKRHWKTLMRLGSARKS